MLKIKSCIKVVKRVVLYDRLLVFVWVYNIDYVCVCG